MKIRFACLGAALALALALAGCGGSSSSRHTPASVPQPTTSAQMTSSAAKSSTSALAAVPAGSAPCRAALLSLRYLGGQGATGHGELGFELRNTSTHPCHTFGYPGILFLDRNGTALPTIPTHTTHDYFGSAPEVRLTLDPGQSASFRLGVTHGISSTAGCTTAYAVQAIPPDDTSTLRVSIPDGAYECRTVTVSPLRPSTSAYPG